MEICELRLAFPQSNRSSTARAAPTTSAIINVYRLEGSVSLSTYPSRIQKLAKLEVRPDLDYWAHRFACSLDELITLELACPITASAVCDIQWRQDKESPPFGKLHLSILPEKTLTYNKYRNSSRSTLITMTPGDCKTLWSQKFELIDLYAPSLA